MAETTRLSFRQRRQVWKIKSYLFLIYLASKRKTR